MKPASGFSEWRYHATVETQITDNSKFHEPKPDCLYCNDAVQIMA